MYCINCGVKLENTEKICPLCNTRVCKFDVITVPDSPLYPADRMPKLKQRSNAFNGAVIIMFLIPAVVSFLADYHFDKNLGWFGYVLGALILAYVTFALPMWFEKPNPVIFTPCAFACATGYLCYINCITDGDWFLTFAFPVAGGFGVISTTFVTLIHYLKKGRLYIWGGAFTLTGAFIVLVEFFMSITFKNYFMGWSLYPFAVFVMLGGLLFYLAINKSAREIMERKLFF